MRPHLSGPKKPSSRKAEDNGVYLDYAATTPVDPAVIKAMQPYFFEKFGNPASMHAFGRQASYAVEESRSEIARILGARTEEIVFTSGGAESNNHAIFGVAWSRRKKGAEILTSAIEHHTVLEPCIFLKKFGFSFKRLPVDKYGMIDPADVKKAINRNTIMISVMQANNEIGTLQPVSEIGRIARQRGVYFHTDAVQSVGHLPVKANELQVDLLSLSAHKFYGPKGTGALYIRKGTRIEKYLHGGSQELGRRASTQNTAGIVGMAQALKICEKKMDSEARFQADLRDNLIRQIQNKIDGVFLNGHPTERLPNNINLAIRGAEAETLLINLDMLGIAASGGSACQAAFSATSHVLAAIGLAPELARSSVRFSIGRWTTGRELNYLIDQLSRIVHKLRRQS